MLDLYENLNSCFMLGPQNEFHSYVKSTYTGTCYKYIKVCCMDCIENSFKVKDGSML